MPINEIKTTKNNVNNGKQIIVTTEWTTNMSNNLGNNINKRKINECNKEGNEYNVGNVLPVLNPGEYRTIPEW